MIPLTQGTQNHQIHREIIKGWWPGAGEGGNGTLLFNGYRVPILQDEKNSGDWLYNYVKLCYIYILLQLKDYFK